MSENTPIYPAGWYADVNAPGTERFYDGTAWTEQTRPMKPAEPAPKGPNAKAAWYKRKAIVIPVAILAGLIVMGSVGSALGGGRGASNVASDTEAVASAPAVEDASPAAVNVPEVAGLTAKEAEALIENVGLEVEFSADKGFVVDRDNWTVLSSTPAAGASVKTGDTVVVNVQKTAELSPSSAPEASAPSSAPVVAEPQKPSMTTAQSSAIRSAKSYLSFAGFSRAGLLEQLTSEYGEGFAGEDAEFAVAQLESTGEVDWNQEAVESAKSYLEFQGFSRDGLYDQLTSEYGEQFTPDQANFALSAVGL